MNSLNTASRYRSKRKKELFVFPFAGGNSTAFVHLAKQLESCCEVTVVDYRGHGRRYAEGPADSLTGIVNDCVGTVTASGAEEIYLLGYSMGSVVAYEVAGKLKECGIYVAHVFYLASNIPTVKPEVVFLWNSEERLIAELRRLGGLPEEVLREEGLLDYFLPIVKNDCRLLCNYKSSELTCVAKQCSVLYSEEEKRNGSIREWDSCGEKVRYEYFEGGHFFLYHNEERIANYVKHVIGKGI